MICNFLKLFIILSDRRLFWLFALNLLVFSYLLWKLFDSITSTESLLSFNNSWNDLLFGQIKTKQQELGKTTLVTWFRGEGGKSRGSQELARQGSSWLWCDLPLESRLKLFSTGVKVVYSSCKAFSNLSFTSSHFKKAK